MPIQFSRLQPRHAEAYRRLRLEALRDFPGHFANSYAVEALEPVSFFETVINTCTVMGLWDDETLIGCGFLFAMWPRHITEQHKAMVAGIYIQPAYQRQGLAKKLMAYMLELAKQQGFRQLHIALYSSNSKARQMYDELGFVEYGREPNGLCVDGVFYDKVWMYKALQEDY